MVNPKLLHPLQSEAWQPIYPNTHRLIAAGTPTNIRLVSPAYSKMPYAIITRPGNRSWDTDGWLQDITLAVSELGVSHLVIEPDGRYLPAGRTLEGFIVSSAPGLTSRYSAVLDLSPSEEELLASCSKSHRQNIRKAIKNGLQFEIFTEGTAGIERFVAIVESMSTSKSFVQYSSAHIENVWQAMSDASSAYIVIGTYEGQDVGGYMVVHNGQEAYQLYGGRTQAGRDNRLAQAIGFEALLQAKRLGIRHYDMWGIGRFDSGGPDKDDEKYGIGKFKLAYGSIPYDHGPNLEHIFDQKAYDRAKLTAKLSQKKLTIKKKLSR